MTRRSNKKDTVATLLLAGLRETFDPLVKAIDAKPALLMEDAADTGHARLSTMDSGIRILLGQICQTIWRQQYGMIKTKNGSIPNNDQRLKKSETDFQELTKEVEDGKTSMDSKHSVALMHWFDVNETRFNACGELLQCFQTLYRETFDEDWKPIVTEDSPTKEVRRTQKADVSPEENARLVALSERFKNRIARVA